MVIYINSLDVPMVKVNPTTEREIQQAKYHNKKENETKT